jgi:hypothetical protein
MTLAFTTPSMLSSIAIIADGHFTNTKQDRMVAAFVLCLTALVVVAILELNLGFDV